MAMQVNVRLEEADWERIVEAMPGLSNGERMTSLVRQQLALLESRHDLPQALELIEAALQPTLQALRRQRLQGQGSEIAEELAQSVIEMAALLLAHADDLTAAPQKHVAGLEAKLARRWSRTALQLLRTVALDPGQIRNQELTTPELQRVLVQVAQLASATSAAGLTPTPLSPETRTSPPSKG
jgi:NTP pyrophosphatase (non-canonical NTP hydrolase)